MIVGILLKEMVASARVMEVEKVSYVVLIRQ